MKWGVSCPCYRRGHTDFREGSHCVQSHPAMEDGLELSCWPVPPTPCPGPHRLRLSQGTSHPGLLFSAPFGPSTQLVSEALRAAVLNQERLCQVTARPLGPATTGAHADQDPAVCPGHPLLSVWQSHPSRMAYCAGAQAPLLSDEVDARVWLEVPLCSILPLRTFLSAPIRPQV